MKKSLKNSIGAGCIALVLATGYTCGPQVARLRSDKVIDISGRWNDTDAQQTSAALVTDLLARPWKEDFVLAQKRKPVIIIGMIANKTHEHINTDVLTQDLEKACLNSGLIRTVANELFRGKVREERGLQKDNATPETQKKFGRELGADFILFGTVNSIVDLYKRRRVIFYKISVELINLETNEKVWIGDKEIKKIVKR